ncbi:MAG: hypothetical protein ACP5SQ_06490 [Candidatus Saccharicenans sp.]
MERRAKKGKKEAIIKFLVRSSSLRENKSEGEIGFFGSCIFDFSLPNPAK